MAAPPLVAPGNICGGGAQPPEILFPPRDAELWAGAVDGQPARAFILAGRGDGDLRWFVDGKPCETDAAGAPIWQPTLAGYYTVSAVDPQGRTTRVNVRVIGAPPA